MSNPPFSCHAFDTDLIQVIAKDIAEKYQEQFPFLENIVVLLPNYHRASDLQQQILVEFGKNSSSALVGPQIYAFRDFIDKTTPINKQAIPKNTRELILIKALEKHKNLFGKQNLLTTAYALLELFDELTRKEISLPHSLDDFIQQLEIAYHCTNEQQESLSKEAQIVHTLWLAWHQQLEEINSIDRESQYQLKLAKNLDQNTDYFYYIAGFFDFLPAEIAWINAQINNNAMTLLFQTEKNIYNTSDQLKQLFSEFDSTATFNDAKNNRNLFFQALFDNDSSHLKIRAEQTGRELRTIHDTVKTFQANAFEEEALAISTQIRLWLNQNKKHIALILEDRRLARRVRALLQRYGIGVQDTAGWALSTTTAASVIENWLQCIEENFHYVPLLDILKSPFAFKQCDTHGHLAYRFEQDLVYRENVARDLDRYKQHWLSRQKRLSEVDNETSPELLNLIEHLALSSEKLKNIHEKNHAFLSEYLDTLKQSLIALNAHELLLQDPAGMVILGLLESLLQSAAHTDIKIDWLTFRHLLSLKLEENNFSPTNFLAPSIELLHLSQTSLGKYDGVIIGGMTKDQFPSAIKQTPFFNQNVRQELGLNDSAKKRHIQFHYFRYLLGASSSILLSYHSGSQESLPSPWLELLIRFHELSFSQSLEHHQLHKILQQQSINPVDKGNLERPSPIINSTLLPQSLSASAHQSLIQCPYAFFAGQLLKLRANDEISEKLSKSDYGERIHLCLQAFHAGGIAELPGPFIENISLETKKSAILLLVEISEQVFSIDLEDNFQHRGWLKRWLNIIPAYVDWQIDHEQHWHFKSGELKTHTTSREGFSLNGRIDRVDHSAGNMSILDYKTGSVPSNLQVENGEAIQLAHYALSNPAKVTQVSYLQFESGTKDVAEKCFMENDELGEVLLQAQNRLNSMYQTFKAGATLPAWGHEQVCQYCQFDGLCRHKL